MPVVVGFRVPKSLLCVCDTVGTARKWVIRGHRDRLFDFGPISVLFNIKEYYAWYYLHQLCDLPRNSHCIDTGELFNESDRNLVMCGGKKSDPFYWCRWTTNGPASCGHVCTFPELSDKWKQSGYGIWRCKGCYDKHFSKF